MFEFIDKYLAHIIGVIALVQVWVIALWKKWIVNGRVEFHPTLNYEIGFSTFGVTVGLPGTLRAIHKDIFVSKMAVSVCRISDNREKKLSWRVFRSNTMSAQTLAPEGIELASCFSVQTSSPKPINVFFASEDFSSKFARQAELVREAWQHYVLNKSTKEQQQLELLSKVPGGLDLLFIEFAKQKAPYALYTSFMEDWYWKAGDYRIDLSVICGPPAQPQKYSWGFSLSEEDAEKLQSNTLLTIKEICEVPTKYNFVYRPYEPHS